MKKILFLIAVLSGMLFTTTAFAIQGEGTEESPFLITTQKELLCINEFPDSHFKLINDIELYGKWTPLDNFTGIFDGNNHEISNLTLSYTSSEAYIGFFSSNYGTIKNLNLSTSQTGINYNYNSTLTTFIGIIASTNSGTIKNCNVTGKIDYTNKELLTPGSLAYIGSITGANTGEISNTKSNCNINVTAYSHWNATEIYLGGIAGQNCKSIKSSVALGNYTISGSNYSYHGGLVGYLLGGTITNSYFHGNLNTNSYDISYTGGIAGYISDSSTIENCYTSNTFTSKKSYGIGYRASSTNSFYDSNISNLTDKTGIPASTADMKSKNNYTDADWDFDNVWGISSDINDGYPYLLWEYAVDSSANAEITSASSTATALKFISTVTTEGEPEIATFGTTFIPLWLFETGSSDVATVQYDNSKYDIQNGQTFGATLGGIPESAKDMVIVGKSFIKDADGNYTWSAVKSASVNNPTLNEVN